MVKIILLIKEYVNLIATTLKKNLVKQGILLFIATLSAIYINLFTSQDALKDFFGIKLNTLGETYFLAVFGLIALISLIRACASLIILGISFFIIGFFLFLIYKIYNTILEKISSFSRFAWELTVLIILLVAELISSTYLILSQISTLNLRSLFGMLLCIFLLQTAIYLEKRIRLYRESQNR